MTDQNVIDRPTSVAPGPRSAPLRLHPDRYFDADPGVRRVARTLYEEIAGLPLICPHGHVDPALLAT